METLGIILLEILKFLMSYGALIVYMMNVPRILHYAQLEGYKNNDFFRWLVKNPKMAFKPALGQAIAICGFYIFTAILNNVLVLKFQSDLAMVVLVIEYFAILTMFIVMNLVQALRDKKKRKLAKKPLVYTSRAKRLMFWNLVTLAFLEVMFLDEIRQSTIGVMFEMVRVVAYSIFTFLLPVNMIISNLLAYPTEKMVGDFYINLAKVKLRRKSYKNLIKIGITGSYGKTSTKFILSTILSEKYNVLATPESYNTTMGNVKVIRKMLKPEHEVFISEMGARYRFDIQEICDLVRPKIGIITSIGPQHLESFKNIDNVVKTKAELLMSLPSDGVVFLPNDDSHCLKLYNKEKREKYIYGINDKHADVYAKDIKFGPDGVCFTAVTKNGEIKCVSSLLGEHNIQNILGCIAIAVYLGLSNEQVANGVRKLEPIPHRLQLLPSSNGTIVIDDAFNSNPVGSKAALDVIDKFDGRKIIITPGMVELGNDEYKYNKEFGKNMATVVDIAILVGVKRSQAIVDGLTEAKFDDKNIFVVDNLENASKRLQEITKPGDVILFENDLPDNYDEK